MCLWPCWIAFAFVDWEKQLKLNPGLSIVQPKFDERTWRIGGRNHNRYSNFIHLMQRIWEYFTDWSAILRKVVQPIQKDRCNSIQYADFLVTRCLLNRRRRSRERRSSRRRSRERQAPDWVPTYPKWHLLWATTWNVECAVWSLLKWFACCRRFCCAVIEFPSWNCQ